MSVSQEHLDLVVDPDGAVHVPATELARLGVRPGDHLRLVRDEQPARGRKTVRGIGVGRVTPDDVLVWEDFEAIHHDNVDAAQRKHADDW